MYVCIYTYILVYTPIIYKYIVPGFVMGISNCFINNILYSIVIIIFSVVT